MYELKLRHVTKEYGDKLALDDFSFTFREGIYGILGANGAGKSTLMNLITDTMHLHFWRCSRRYICACAAVSSGA